MGGPLALAAQAAPGTIADTPASAGFVAVAAALLFGFPLLCWWKYAREVTGPGGLYDYVVAAVGRPVGLVHAGLWVISYGLYVLYTTASIVYDTLPTVWPGVVGYQPVFELAIPLVLAAVLLSGLRATVLVVGVMALAQVALLAVLAVVAIRHAAPASSFAPHRRFDDLVKPVAQLSLFFVCASLPLYLGGEVVRARRTVRTGVLAGVGIAAVGLVAVVFPLAADPAFAQAALPGMSMAEVLANPDLGVAIGIGVAVSVAAVLLLEAVALSRLVHAVTGLGRPTAVRVLAALLLVSGPLGLVNPEFLYERMLRPSLLTLWLAQLVVFVAYPWFAAQHGGLRWHDLVIAAGASAVAGFGVYAALFLLSSS